MPSKTAKLTKLVVAEAETQKTEYAIWDPRVPGFGLRVRPSGHKSYIYVYRTEGGRAGKLKRVTIKADQPETALEQAKVLAARFYSGGDPADDKAQAKLAAEKARQTLSMKDFLCGFIDNYAKVELKPKTYLEYERIVNKILVPNIGKIKVDALNDQHVKDLHKTIGKNTPKARVAILTLSSAMEWAEREGVRPKRSNPTHGEELVKIKARDRLFSDDEVRRMHASIDKLEDEAKISPSIALGIRLLFKTGCRAGEICALKWEYIDWQRGFIRWPDTKTGAMVKPLTASVRALLEATAPAKNLPWVCPSATRKQMRVDVLSRGFRWVMKDAGVDPKERASAHLIRHWFATQIYTDPNIARPLALRLVGHKSDSTASRYTHIADHMLWQVGEASDARIESKLRLVTDEAPKEEAAA